MNDPLLRSCRQPHDSIVLRSSRDGWMAEFYGPHADEVVRLFGTNVLPTAFTSQAEHSVVKAEIDRLNPGIEVVLGCPIYSKPLTHRHGNETLERS